MEASFNKRIVWLDRDQPNLRLQGKRDRSKNTDMRCLWQVVPRWLSGGSIRGRSENHQNLDSLGHFFVIGGRVGCAVLVRAERCGGRGALSSPSSDK